jgi:hypothetical protein
MSAMLAAVSIASRAAYFLELLSTFDMDLINLAKTRVIVTACIFDVVLLRSRDGISVAAHPLAEAVWPRQAAF